MTPEPDSGDPVKQKWEQPAVLRLRPNADSIECQAVLSGRWKPLSDAYWDSCVIPVPYRHNEPEEPRP